MLNKTNVPTILHVDDDENDRMLLNIAHRRANLPANLIGVGDGEQAIAYLEGRGAYSDRDRCPIPDLVLLDLKLPLKSGFEVLEWIREQDSFRDLRVIVLSSSHHETDRARAFVTGANFYIVKPVSVDEMIGMAKQLHANWLCPVPLWGCA
jgi:CheY-like chemotaxis protein